MTLSPIFAIAVQICKGVNPRWCGQRFQCGYFQFWIGTQRIASDGNRLWIQIGTVSFEYLELIDQQKPSEKRRAIRKLIRDLREYIRLNINDIPEE